MSTWHRWLPPGVSDWRVVFRQAPLNWLLGWLIRRGTIKVIDWNGNVRQFGDGGSPRVAIRILDAETYWQIGVDPELAFGEAYTDGRFTMAEGTLHELVDLILANMGTAGLRLPFPRLIGGLRRVLRRLRQWNPVHLSQGRISHHYDLPDHLYDGFLDPDRQYSCAYFNSPDDDLATAQRNKKRHITNKLRLKPGQRVLDIGSGWGGLALTIAEQTGADVTGVTLSTKQHDVSNRRAVEAGVSDRVRFLLQDYRHVGGQFDRIVSVGMFEHVGVNHYSEYFRQVRALLAADGVALVHTIGRIDGPGETNAWIAKHIFPGGYSPALSEIMAAVEKSGLVICDVEVLRLHYAETLRHWRERFMAWAPTAEPPLEPGLTRMWEFYLSCSEASFRYGGLVVFQLQLARQQDAVPLTRDYLYA